MITILQIEDRDDEFLQILMNENKKICKQNEYNYVNMKKSMKHVPPYWGKIFELKRLMKQTKLNSYIMWLDSDAFIVNSKNLDKLVKGNPQFSMFITGDMPPYFSSFNAGSFIIKNNVVGKEIVQKWTECYNSNDWTFNNGKWTTNKSWAGEAYEQGSFIKFLLPIYKSQNTIKIMNYYTLNNNDCKHLHKDTISIHLAGIFKNMKKAQCTQLINNHYQDKYFNIYILGVCVCLYILFTL